MITASALAAVAVAQSRVLLGGHSVAEIVVGLVIGFTCVAAFAGLSRIRLPPAQTAAVAGCFGLVVLLSHGAHLSLEDKIRNFSYRIDRIVQESVRGEPAPTGSADATDRPVRDHAAAA